MVLGWGAFTLSVMIAAQTAGIPPKQDRIGGAKVAMQRRDDAGQFIVADQADL